MDNSTDRFTEEIEQLKAKKPSLLDLLISSPFDDKMDIDEKLTESIFYERLYVEDEYEDLAEELMQTIKGGIRSHTVILISGYAGTGKSTFIRTFMKKTTPSFVHHYLTFDDRSIFPSISRTDDEILNLIKRYLYTRNDIRKTIAFLVANRGNLKAGQLISDNLYSYTKEPKPLEPDSILDLITEFDIKDTFTCFFCHFFLNFQENKTTMVYFDNLDNVKLEFLSSNFLAYFHESLVDANVLRKLGDFAEKEISLTNFRFIFCLRDANGALANHHLASRTPFNVVPFKIAFKPAFYQRVIEKRLDFLTEIFAETHVFGKIPIDTARRIFKQLIEDSYFQRAFLPFFNNDYRTTVKALSDILQKAEEYEDFTKGLSYVLRGNLLFGLIRYALGKDYLEKYRESQIPSSSSGWCYIDRVLLTVIMNRSKYNRGKHEIGMSESDPWESYYLVDCIQQLEEFYSVRELLAAVSRCFLYHERNWTHLLTISSVNITRKEQGDFISEFCEKYAARERLDSRDRANLNNIRVRVNPAGFTFVRYILIHFEFYSNLVRNQNPLSIRASEIDSRPKSFQFEDTIDRVIELVSFHIKSMETFYNEKYAKVIGPLDSFYSSDYCFRHLGNANIALEKGYFHSTRIINSHINYIDQFRGEVLRKFKNSGGEILKRINSILIGKIQSYIDLLRDSIDERGKNDFISDFEEAIRAIEADFGRAAEIKIEKKKGGGLSRKDPPIQQKPK